MKIIAMALCAALVAFPAVCAPAPPPVGSDGHGLPPAGTQDPRDAMIRTLEAQVHTGQPDAQRVQAEETELKLMVAELRAQREGQSDQAAFDCVALDMRGGSPGCVIHPQETPPAAAQAPQPHH